MSNYDSSFIQIYRDLLTDPSFIGLPPSYRCVLFSLLANACFMPCQQDDHGVLIDLLPGQFMCTIRHLAEISNVGRKDAEHAISKFIALKIVGQEVGHRKSIFTILWGIKLNNGGTRSGTRKGQERDIKEEGKKERMLKEEKDMVTTTKEKEKMVGGGFSEDVVLFNLKGEKVQANSSDIYRHFLKFEYPTEIISQAIREIKLYKTPVSNILKCLESICLRLFKISQEPVVKPIKKQKPIMEDIPKTEAKGVKFDIKKLKEKFK